MIKNAIVLAAGYATRLNMNISKPLIEVGGKPIISYLLKKLENNGITNICVVTNNRYFLDYQNIFSSRVRLINDGTNSNEERLGALRDLALALKLIYSGKLKDTLVLLGDNLFEDDLSDFFKKYNSREPKKSLIGVYDLNDIHLAKNYGIIEIDENERIKSFKEKPEKPKTTLVSTGIYAFPSKILQLLDFYLSDKKNPFEGPGNFISWLIEKGYDLYAYKLRGKWWDIGTIESLEDAKNFNG
ncbi:MAG: nucleotidyltransferase family protein [Candidatus Aenigmatarchaeota archaeon]